MTSGLLRKVRAASKEVASKARYVQLDAARAASHAASLPLGETKTPELDPRYHYSGGPEGTVAYLLTLDTINFGSGYFPHLHKRENLSGYFTIAAALKDHFESHGPFSADQLSMLTAQDCAAMFRQQPDGGPRSELMSLFATALNDLGRYLLERFDGEFTSLVEAAGASAERLVQLLIEMPLFQDVAVYESLEVPFYKRGQITAADLSLAFQGKGFGRFNDLDQLTIFADNLVPHVLRVDGILHYDDSLAARIDAGELISSGSMEEVEIRATALHAVELLVEEVRKKGQEVTAMQLDYVLWNRGQQPEYRAKPRHRTRTVFY